MSTQERDTHFQGFSNLLFPEISQLFFTMYARILEHGQIEEIDSIKDEIKTLIAQRAYDLVYHSLDNIWEVHNPAILISKIPDITEWPIP
jgi:hypothetical protein